MSTISLEMLNSHEKIALLIAELRGENQFLSYDEYLVVEEWVKLCPNIDLLSETLVTLNADEFRKRSKNGSLKSVTSLRKKITRQLTSTMMQQAPEVLHDNIS